jgi:hypothetical protein
VLPPIDPDTGSDQEYDNEECSEYEEYLDDGLDSEADHNMDT